jgi:hypothetical protein
MKRAVREYLAVLDDAAFGAATPVTPKYFAPVDPAARWTAANSGLAFFAYATNPDRPRSFRHRRGRGLQCVRHFRT